MQPWSTVIADPRRTLHQQRTRLRQGEHCFFLFQRRPLWQLQSTLHFCRPEQVTGVSGYHYVQLKGQQLLRRQPTSRPNHLVLTVGVHGCLLSQLCQGHALLFILKKMTPWTLCQHFIFSSVCISAWPLQPLSLY